MSRPIQIVEVGPRDGLQNETAILEPVERVEFIARLEAATAGLASRWNIRKPPMPAAARVRPMVGVAQTWALSPPNSDRA